jgi:hypothetical protein
VGIGGSAGIGGSTETGRDSVGIGSNSMGTGCDSAGIGRDGMGIGGDSVEIGSSTGIGGSVGNLEIHIRDWAMQGSAVVPLGMGGHVQLGIDDSVRNAKIVIRDWSVQGRGMIDAIGRQYLQRRWGGNNSGGLMMRFTCHALSPTGHGVTQSSSAARFAKVLDASAVAFRARARLCLTLLICTINRSNRWLHRWRSQAKRCGAEFF